MSAKRPKKPQFRPPVEPTCRYRDPSGDFDVVDENPAYAAYVEGYRADLGRYERALRLYNASRGIFGNTPWHDQQVGLGVERCPQPADIERQPGVIEALWRRTR